MIMGVASCTKPIGFFRLNDSSCCLFVVIVVAVVVVVVFFGGGGGVHPTGHGSCSKPFGKAFTSNNPKEGQDTRPG